MAQLTIGELVEQLQKYPIEALVRAEGCDCSGEVNGIEDLGVYAQPGDRIRNLVVLITVTGGEGERDRERR